MAKAPIEIRSLARQHTEMAVRVLGSIMTDNKAPQSARVAAAQALLDRGWGKPDQTTHIVKHDVSDLTDAEIIARLAELRGDGATDGPAQPSPNPSQLN